MSFFVDRVRRCSWLLIAVLGLGIIALTGEQGATAAMQSSTIMPSEVVDRSNAMIAELRQKAFIASQTGDFAAAETYWSQLIDYLPQDAALWSNRGNIRLAQNQPGLAIDDYSQAIELAPQAPDPYLNRGAALEALGRWQAAIADYNQVLALNPKDAAAYNNRGNARAGLGEWAVALRDYQHAVELNPAFALARINQALAAYQLGQPQDAIAELRALVRRYPNFADARAALTAGRSREPLGGRGWPR